MMQKCIARQFDMKSIQQSGNKRAKPFMILINCMTCLVS